LRGSGDGFAVFILPVYLSAIGYSAAQIAAQVGIVAIASLPGTAAFTLGVEIIAPRYELRQIQR
jgi:Na+/melibiose symporter-like transporter